MKNLETKKGILYLYYASFCEIILLGVALFATIISIIAGATELEAIAPIFSILAIIVLVLSIALLILKIIGAYKASKENVNFNYAFFALIAALVLSLLNVFIGNSIVSGIFRALENIAEIAFLYFVIKGLIELFAALGDQDLASKGKKTLLIVIVAFCVQVVFDSVSGFMTSESLILIANIIDLIANVAGIIGIVFF